jgi:hypothetical protein
MSDRNKSPIFVAGASTWFCDYCGAHGPANFAPDAKAFAAVEAIREAHAKQSPTCRGGKNYRIQVVNVGRLKAKGRVA